MTVRLRGHHLLCMLTNEGIGYTEEFAENFDDILARLSAGEDIEIMDGPDDVCSALIRSGEDEEVHCYRKSVIKRDRLALAAVGKVLDLQLTSESTMSLNSESLNQLRAAFQDGSIRGACFKCQWYDKCSETAARNFESVRLSMTTQKDKS